MSEHTFDLTDRLTELRCHSTEWLRARDIELEAQQRGLRVEQLAVRRVLDERGRIDPAEDTLLARHGESPRTARQALEVSRALESLPAIAAVAHAGTLSWDQLKPLVEIATPETDARWAARAPGYSPIDLERLARRQRGVTDEEAATRTEARELKWWWEQDTGMLGLRGRLPDVDGAIVRGVLERMVNRMRPPQGEPWDTLAHRGADALVDLCKNQSDATPGRTRSHITFHVPANGPAELDGIPIAESTLARLLPDATITTSIVEDNRLLVPVRDTDDIPEAVKRFVRARDHHCRVGTCEETRGLDYHHLRPRSEGGTHDPDNIVLAGKPCGHHQMLIPNGPWILAGDPSQLDGLRLTRRDQLARAP
jgi:hypothetical protein